VESPLESPPEELTRLRDTLNELRDIMARSALWAGGAPPVAQMSMDALFGIASELEERVAERARALVAAHEALRESERNSRLVVDSIPGLVALLTPAGEVEFVNRQILEYTGQTLAELNQWGTNPRARNSYLTRSTRRRLTGWASACRSAAPSSRDTVAASGQSRTTDQGPRSGCRFLAPAKGWPSRRREGLGPIPRCNGRRRSHWRILCHGIGIRPSRQ
jgi:hypothetical protein